MPFFAFQMLLILLYVSSVLSPGAKLSFKTVSEPLTADNFNFSVNLNSGDEVSFNGTKLWKTQEQFKFAAPKGYYKVKDDNDKVFFSGREGQISNDKNFYLKGNVELNRKDATFKSEELFFDSGAKTFTSKTPATILSEDGRFDGVDFSYNMVERRMKLKNVKGRIEF